MSRMGSGSHLMAAVDARSRGVDPASLQYEVVGSLQVVTISDDIVSLTDCVPFLFRLTSSMLFPRTMPTIYLQRLHYLQGARQALAEGQVAAFTCSK